MTSHFIQHARMQLERVGKTVTGLNARHRGGGVMQYAAFQGSYWSRADTGKKEELG